MLIVSDFVVGYVMGCLIRNQFFCASLLKKQSHFDCSYLNEYSPVPDIQYTIGQLKECSIQLSADVKIDSYD